ncbi:hypothetical protein C8J56DRAFT_885545 [Mycena floridula]|nr:hypothetical protein C8J56DRAFT_885545 [Mycena floridula]
MRSILNSKTVWVVATGTATPEEGLEIAKILSFQKGHYIDAHLSLDRPNLNYITCFFQHSISGSTFLDLSFLIPFGITSLSQIELTIIFVKTIQMENALMQFLDSLIPKTIPNRLKAVKLYNSLMSLEYRNKFFEDFQDGLTLRIGIVTDTATYGLDLRVHCVLIIGMRSSHAVLKQQIGQAGRDGLPAKVIAYVPGWIREVTLSEKPSVQEKEDLKRREGLSSVQRQFYNATEKLCSRSADLKHYGEVSPDPKDCLCSIHAPDKEGKDQKLVLRSDQTFKPLEPAMKESLTLLLECWGAQHWATIRGTQTGLTYAFFLPKRIIRIIVDHAHICSTQLRFREIAHEWRYLDQHGDILFKYLMKVMEGFQDIIKSRVQKSSVKVEPEVSELDSTVAQPIRLPVLRPSNIITIKRPVAPGNSPKKAKKVKVQVNNEN